ncbi:MAG TPA: hypothetical protein VMV34_06390, partial [Terriglobia bacterium]|nr:hypothetical protein [Terriglobia bacterium]
QRSERLAGSLSRVSLGGSIALPDVFLRHHHILLPGPGVRWRGKESPGQRPIFFATLGVLLLVVGL